MEKRVKNKKSFLEISFGWLFKSHAKGKKGFLEISFGWLFAIIIGIFVIGFAIYAATQIIGSGQTEQGVVASKQIGALLNPLETGFESGVSTSLTVSKESIIQVSCDNFGEFGNQLMKVSQKNFGRFSENDIEVSFENKYIFSEKETLGKKFHIFSKPFEFPYKVADLIYLTSSQDRYCFLEPPEKVEDEIKNLNQENLIVDTCKDSDIKVCFQRDSQCDIYVEENLKRVLKNGKAQYYETDSLMYGAIFSDTQTYECNLKRLAQRAKNLATLYDEKAKLVSSRTSCDYNLDLLSYADSLGGFDNSLELQSLYFTGRELDKKNKDIGECRLW